MLIDGQKLVEGSQATNLVVASGNEFPSSPNLGELFYKIDFGLFFYNGATWTEVNTLTNGKIAASNLPSIAITDTFVVESEAAMLALIAETGDVAVRTDDGKTYILAANPASTLSNWIALAATTTGPTGPQGSIGPIGPTGPMGPAGGGSGSFDPLGKPTAVSYTYDGDGLVSSVTSTYNTLDLVQYFSYNSDGTVHQIVSTYNGSTKTETYTYSTGGVVSLISIT